MTNIIEVTDYTTGENFAVDPSAMRDFLKEQSNIDPAYDKDAADVIEQICQDVRMGVCGFSYFMGMDYAPGIYRGELPACGWIEVED